MRGKFSILCLLALILTACGKTEGDVPEMVRNSENLVATIEKDEIQQSNIILYLEQMEEVPAPDWKESSILTTERVPDEGYTIDGVTAEVYNRQERFEKEEVPGEVVVKKKTQRSVFQKKEEEVINELTGNGVYTAWAVVGEENTEVYLYNRESHETKKISTFPNNNEAILLSMGHEKLLCRQGWMLYSYDLQTLKRRELSQDLSGSDIYGRPEIVDGVVAIVERNELVQLDLEQNRQRRSALGEGTEVVGLKGNWDYAAWRSEDQAITLLKTESGEISTIQVGKNIFSYHISGNQMAINLSDEIVLVDLQNYTKSTIPIPKDQFVNYGRVLPNGNIQFLLEGEQITKYLTFFIQK